MRWAFVGLLLLHGVIHLMGFAKAFGLAELPQLTQPISRPLGLAWLLAALLVAASAVAFVAWPRGFWMLGLAALVVSQGVIITSWLDARFGTIANVFLLMAVVIGAAMWGPTSARARLERESQQGLARVRDASPVLVTEADLAALPAPVAGYLRASGWLGRPRTAAYHLRFRGRIRGAADEPWMDFTAEQRSFADRPTRLFLMDASMYGLPVQSCLSFGDDGMLRDFVSDDRLRASRDGSSFTPQRFSTPIHELGAFGRHADGFGPVRLMARADARWHPPEGELVYGEFELLEITFLP